MTEVWLSVSAWGVLILVRGAAEKRRTGGVGPSQPSMPAGAGGGLGGGELGRPTASTMDARPRSAWLVLTMSAMMEGMAGMRVRPWTLSKPSINGAVLR